MPLSHSRFAAMAIGDVQCSGDSAGAEWRHCLHNGAHKTATTHLQDTLSRNGRFLLRNGCVYVPRSLVRGSGLLPAVEENHWSLMRPWDKRRALHQFLEIPADYPRSLLLSEEDILGMSANLLEGLYPHARARLTPWAALAQEGGGMELFLSIRDYAEILPSAYSQALRDGAVLPPFGACAAHWNAMRRGWPDLAATILGLFPTARLTVWTAEAYLQAPAPVFRAFCGTALTDVPMQAPEGTRRMSARAVARIGRLDEGLTGSARREAVKAIAAEEAGGEPFDPLSGSGKALLSARYRQDIDRLRRMRLHFLG